MRTALSGVLTLALVFGSTEAHARWLKENDAPAHFDEISTEIKVNKDYSMEVTQTFSAVVDDQAALEELSVFRVVYSPELAETKVLSARVSVGQHIYLINPKNVEDKPVPEQKGGYDKLREIRVIFPQIAVRATIEVKLWRKESPPIPGVLSSTIPLANVYPVRAQRLTLESEAPIAWKLHDPFKEFKVTEGKAKKGVKFEIASEKSVYHQLVEEPFTAFSEPQHPTLYLGTTASWGDLGGKVAAAYDKVFAEPLPDELKKVIDTLKTHPDKLAQVELALDAIRKQVHFLGAWQSFDGKYFPRAIKETISSRFADGRDYAAVSVAVLHALGHDAQVAWTAIHVENPAAPKGGRGRVVQFQPPVTGLYFNHAIVKAKIDGKDYWFDPASPVAYVRGVASHIGGTYALVLKTGGSKLEMIPFATAEENSIEATRYLTVNNDKTFDEVIRSKVKGFITAAMTSDDPSKEEEKRLLRDADESVNDILSKGQAPKAPSGELWMDHAHGGVELSAAGSSGASVKFEVPKDLNPLLQESEKASGGILLPIPTKQSLTTIIQGGALSGEPPRECKVDTPYFKLSRVFSREFSMIKVVESSEIKMAFVPSADVHGPAVKEAKAALEKCWNQATLNFDHDGLIDPKFRYRHAEPWKVTGFQLEAEKVKKHIPRLWSKITGKKGTERTFTYAKVAPDWTKDKTITEVKTMARELIDDWSGLDMKPLLVKMLMLEQIQAKPEDADPLALIAMAELQAGSTKEDEYDPKAVERARFAVYSALELAPKSPLANRTLAQVLSAAKENADAIRAAKFALSLEPKSDSGKSTLARALLRSNDARKALEALGTVEDFPLLEAIYMSLAKPDKVAETFEADLKKKPSAWTYMKYATYMNNQGASDKAIELAKKALEFRDSTMGHRILSEAYVRKGSTAMDQSKKVEDGLEWLGKALIEDHRNVLAHQIVGSILIQRGRETKDERLTMMGTQHIQTADRLQREEEGLGRAPASAGAVPAVAASPAGAAPAGQ